MTSATSSFWQLRNGKPTKWLAGAHKTGISLSMKFSFLPTANPKISFFHLCAPNLAPSTSLS